MAINENLLFSLNAPGSGALQLGAGGNTLLNTFNAIKANQRAEAQAQQNSLLNQQRLIGMGQNQQTREIQNRQLGVQELVPFAAPIREAIASRNMGELTALIDRMPPEAREESMQMLASGDLVGLDNAAAAIESIGAQSPDTRTAFERAEELQTEGLTPEQKLRRNLIRARLIPGEVGSASQTIARTGGTEDVAKSQERIKEREGFGLEQGKSRSKIIKENVDSLAKIRTAVDNYDEAIAAVEAGADTSKLGSLFPSIRNSSLLLDNVANRMGLDVVGSVTFGALSEGELAIARQTAFQPGLGKEGTIKWLQQRKAAQEKLGEYLRDQISFIDSGGTVAGFLEKKKFEQERAEAQQAAPSSTQAPQGATQAAPTRVLNFDAQGNLL